VRENFDETGVIEPIEGSAFRPKEFLQFGASVSGNLDRHFVFKDGVLGQVHATHSAGADYV
jgi:hypothetical protein